MVTGDMSIFMEDECVLEYDVCQFNQYFDYTGIVQVYDKIISRSSFATPHKDYHTARRVGMHIPQLHLCCH